MDYFQELENAYKIFSEVDLNYEKYICSEIIKFYEKNDYYMFKNFVEHNYSKFDDNRNKFKSYKILERLHIEINGYLFTPYTTFSSGCKDIIKIIKESYPLI